MIGKDKYLKRMIQKCPSTNKIYTCVSLISACVSVHYFKVNIKFVTFDTQPNNQYNNV